MLSKSRNHAKKCTKKQESVRRVFLTSSPIPAPEAAPSSTQFFLVLRNSWLANIRSGLLHQQCGHGSLGYQQLGLSDMFTCLTTSTTSLACSHFGLRI